MKKIIFLIILTISYLCVFAKQDDTVKVMQSDKVPVIDGISNDIAWNETSWQSIDQVWIPWGDYVDSSDYYGNYKVLWSPEKNLLYFLFEIYDDVWVDGFEFNGSNESYNYDIIEVFIDQDNSGGVHIFDDKVVGTISEDAFSYHISIDFPSEDSVNSNFVALDFDGTGWANNLIINYANHFPELALRKSGDKYCWEFSLKVFDNTYDNESPEASRVILKQNDIIGLSVAYCDNDDPNETPKLRDNFFGSVFVTEENYNNHWMNSDDYGILQLIGNPTSVKSSKHESQTNFEVYPNPSYGNLKYSVKNEQLGELNIRIFNILGQQVYKISRSKNNYENSDNLNLEFLSSGTYIISAEINNITLNRIFNFLEN
ncbi:MAG: T9SS type A sorting domain-containing protein [Ignavibacteriae bacterium]|nr:T9SS type A sorting domain-containing protein [Ignavibacteriota bacterium]